MLIGISGKIGSGKDTVGNIIQYLTALKKYPDIQPSYEEFSKLSQKEIQDNPYLEGSISDWEIKKYADKLKDFVCMLIGCTREQLEDREFKEKELGEEWWYTYGKIGNVDILVSYLDMDKEFKNNNNAYIEKLTPRELFQIIGTDCIRGKVHPNAWVNALFADYKGVNNWSYLQEPTKEDFEKDSTYPNWIITDVRFPNELEAIKSRGGITIRVNRPYTTVVGGNGIPATFSQKQFHPSETSLDSATFDFVISNDKDIEHLINEVRKILEKLSII